MKVKILEYLICPVCLPEENSLRLWNSRSSDGEVIEGILECGCCGRAYPIKRGVACLMPFSRPARRPKVPGSGGAYGSYKSRKSYGTPFLKAGRAGGRAFQVRQSRPAGLSAYESPSILSAYLWSHYADLFEDPDVTGAYSEWAGQIEPFSGAALDTGCATGRFSFEMSRKCDLVIGVDTSMSFISTARRIMHERKLVFRIREEGLMDSERAFVLPPEWDSTKVDFIVADAGALPFSSGSFACVASLNLVDKTPRPLEHISEASRAARTGRAQLLISDPFSWSEQACAPARWLGGAPGGRFSGSGIDNIARLLSGKDLPGGFPWKIARRGAVWWKIRNHRNHFELIRSLFVKAER